MLTLLLQIVFVAYCSGSSFSATDSRSHAATVASCDNAAWLAPRGNAHRTSQSCVPGPPTQGATNLSLAWRHTFDAYPSAGSSDVIVFTGETGGSAPVLCYILSLYVNGSQFVTQPFLACVDALTGAVRSNVSIPLQSDSVSGPLGIILTAGGVILARTPTSDPHVAQLTAYTSSMPPTVLWAKLMVNSPQTSPMPLRDSNAFVLLTVDDGVLTIMDAATGDVVATRTSSLSSLPLDTLLLSAASDATLLLPTRDSIIACSLNSTTNGACAASYTPAVGSALSNPLISTCGADSDEIVFVAVTGSAHTTFIVFNASDGVVLHSQVWDTVYTVTLLASTCDAVHENSTLLYVRFSSSAGDTFVSLLNVSSNIAARVDATVISVECVAELLLPSSLIGTTDRGVADAAGRLYYGVYDDLPGSLWALNPVTRNFTPFATSVVCADAALILNVTAAIAHVDAVIISHAYDSSRGIAGNVIINVGAMQVNAVVGS